MKCNVVLLVVVAACLSSIDAAATNPREPSANDIREALLMLDGSMRNYGDKLERHEGRERQLGDILRRSLNGIDKRVALLQRQSDEKSRELDRFLIQSEERERIQQQKIAQSVEAIGSMLESRLSRIEATLLELTAEKTMESPCTQSFMPKVESIEKMMDVMQNSISEKLKEMAASTEFVDKFEESLALNLNKSTQILEHLEDGGVQNEKVQKEHPESEELKTLLYKTSENFDAVNSHIEKASNESLTHYKEMEALMNRIDQEIKTLVENKMDASMQKLNDLEAKFTVIGKGNEETTENEEQVDAILRDISTVRDEIQALANLNEANKKDLQSDILNTGRESQKGTSDMREAVLKEIADVMIKLSPEPLLKTLTDMEHVMLQAADGVMDVGRRVEYSAARVIGELSEEIKSKSAIIESTITSRLDNLASSVLVNQTGAMETLSQRVESEISQVWRQIGIMYQQLTQSVGMLDKLQEQTEHYVNGSLKSMGSVQGRVGEIRDRVGEVEGNLNYLLGRLSLVSTEFNLVKAGLAEALDDVRRNMATVNSNIRETAPGTEYDHVNQVAPVEGQ